MGRSGRSISIDMPPYDQPMMKTTFMNASGSRSWSPPPSTCPKCRPPQPKPTVSASSADSPAKKRKKYTYERERVSDMSPEDQQTRKKFLALARQPLTSANGMENVDILEARIACWTGRYVLSFLPLIVTHKGDRKMKGGWYQASTSTGAPSSTASASRFSFFLIVFTSAFFHRSMSASILALRSLQHIETTGNFSYTFWSR